MHTEALLYGMLIPPKQKTAEKSPPCRQQISVIPFTPDRYGHFTKRMKQDSAARMEALIKANLSLQRENRRKPSRKLR